MIRTSEARRSGAGTALAMLAMAGQLALAGIGGLAALDPAGWPSVIEVCTAYGIKRIALPREATDDDRTAPVRLADTAACHAFCSAQGPTLPALASLPGSSYAVPAGARPAEACDRAPVLHRHQPLLARPPPSA